MITNNDNALPDIYDALYRFGINANTRAFFQMTYAIRLVMDDPERLTMITKMLYPQVAQVYQTSWKNVERNLRRITRRAWRNNPELLRRMARGGLLRCPTASQFIAIVAAYLRTKDDT